MAERICSIEDCDKPVGLKGARGWCPKHYQRWQRTGSTDDPFRTGCDIDGCDEPHRGRGMCQRHYHKWRNQRQAGESEPCSVEGCDRPVYGRGWCQKHYNRWRAKGSTDSYRDLSEEERWWAQVTKTDSCWLWTGSRDRLGYGHFAKRGAMAHRFGYELLVGPIPEGLTLDHLCRNPPCVNPAHLEPVTLRDNILRGESPFVINARKTHCKRGHEFTPENTYVQPGAAHRRCRECTRNRRQREKEARTR